MVRLPSRTNLTVIQEGCAETVTITILIRIYFMTAGTTGTDLAVIQESLTETETRAVFCPVLNSSGIATNAFKTVIRKGIAKAFTITIHIRIRLVTCHSS